MKNKLLKKLRNRSLWGVWADETELEIYQLDDFPLDVAQFMAPELDADELVLAADIVKNTVKTDVKVFNLFFEAFKYLMNRRSDIFDYYDYIENILTINQKNQILRRYFKF